MLRYASKHDIIMLYDILLHTKYIIILYVTLLNNNNISRWQKIELGEVHFFNPHIYSIHNKYELINVV